MSDYHYVWSFVEKMILLILINFLQVWFNNYNLHKIYVTMQNTITITPPLSLFCHHSYCIVSLLSAML